MPADVLLVDDDQAVLSGLRRALQVAGYRVRVAEDGERALAIAAESSLDLVILDVMLPGLNGLAVSQRVRERSSVPILMLSARDTVPDRVGGLDAGADDYLVKPFAVAELLARVRALLRRLPPAENALSYADIVLDSGTHEASRSGEALRLTTTEFELLEMFLRHPRQVLSRIQLCQQVWRYPYAGESNFVDVAVMELRRKLEAGGRPRVIQTSRGLGYVLREA